MLAVVEDPQAMARFGAGKRNNLQVRSEAMEYRLTGRFLRKIGRNQLSRSKTTLRPATQIAPACQRGQVERSGRGKMQKRREAWLAFIIRS
jgi:hypothetical protein